MLGVQRGVWRCDCRIKNKRLGDGVAWFKTCLGAAFRRGRGESLGSSYVQKTHTDLLYRLPGPSR